MPLIRDRLIVALAGATLVTGVAVITWLAFMGFTEIIEWLLG